MARQAPTKAAGEAIPDHRSLDMEALSIKHTAAQEVRNLCQVYDGLSVVHELMFDFVGGSTPEHNLTNSQAERLVQAAKGLVTLLGNSITEVEGALESSEAVLKEAAQRS